MSSVNKQIILGYIGRVELKTFDWGNVFKFSVATTEKYVKKDGEKVENTTWHNCEATGKLADTLNKFFAVGSPIYVEGPTIQEKYDKEGQTHYINKVKVSMFSFVPTAKNASPKQAENDTPPAPAPPPAQTIQPNENEADGLPF